MSGSQYALLAYALSLTLLLGYGQLVWWSRRRLRRKRP